MDSVRLGKDFLITVFSLVGDYGPTLSFFPPNPEYCFLSSLPFLLPPASFSPDSNHPRSPFPVLSCGLQRWYEGRKHFISCMTLENHQLHCKLKLTFDMRTIPTYDLMISLTLYTRIEVKKFSSYSNTIYLTRRITNYSKNGSWNLNNIGSKPRIS